MFKIVASANWAIRAFVLLLGFEPRFDGSKPSGLPLADWRMTLLQNIHQFGIIVKEEKNMTKRISLSIPGDLYEQAKSCYKPLGHTTLTSLVLSGLRQQVNNQITQQRESNQTSRKQAGSFI